jgi:anti-sigma factor RsiW
MKECEPFKGLLVGLLDGELTADEAREVNEHLIRCAACRTEHEKLRETTGRLAAISYQEPGEAELERLWRSPYSRLARNSALTMIIGGYLGLMGFAIYEFFRSGKEGLTVKVALAAIGFGVLLLLDELIRERVKSYKTDPYKEIKR